MTSSNVIVLTSMSRQPFARTLVTLASVMLNVLLLVTEEATRDIAALLMPAEKTRVLTASGDTASYWGLKLVNALPLANESISPVQGRHARRADCRNE